MRIFCQNQPQSWQTIVLEAERSPALALLLREIAVRFVSFAVRFVGFADDLSDSVDRFAGFAVPCVVSAEKLCS